MTSRYDGLITQITLPKGLDYKFHDTIIRTQFLLYKVLVSCTLMTHSDVAVNILQ